MQTVSAILPVVFMLALGCFARKFKIISDAQNAGIKKLIFTILLPILVFNASFTMQVEARYMKLMAYMFVLQCAVLALGFLAFRLIKNRYSHISPYLMTTIEGGNAFYPLYISLVGTAYTSYFVLLDVPGIFMIFLVIPLILAGTKSGGSSGASMIRDVYTNPIVCALVMGLVLNLTGVSAAFAKTSAFSAYEALASSATAPIAPLILFTLGHSFSIRANNLGAMLVTLAVRFAFMACGLFAAFAIFPWILSDPQLKIAVILFLACPPAFASPIILEKQCRCEEDGQFCSTYISLHMIATVLVFAILAAVA